MRRDVIWLLGLSKQVVFDDYFPSFSLCNCNKWFYGKSVFEFDQYCNINLLVNDEHEEREAHSSTCLVININYLK